jgi:hypothetical protein
MDDRGTLPQYMGTVLQVQWKLARYVTLQEAVWCQIDTYTAEQAFQNTNDHPAMKSFNFNKQYETQTVWADRPILPLHGN